MAKILIIDDSWVARQWLISILKEKGHELFEASNGKEGLGMVGEVKPDFIILDLLMPELDGVGVLENFRENGNDIPVIILTADIQKTTREKCLKLGAVEVLNKPPRENELHEIIKKTLN